MWKLALPMVSGSLSVAGVPLVEDAHREHAIDVQLGTLFLTKRPHGDASTC